MCVDSIVIFSSPNLHPSRWWCEILFLLPFLQPEHWSAWRGWCLQRLLQSSRWLMKLLPTSSLLQLLMFEDIKRDWKKCDESESQRKKESRIFVLNQHHDALFIRFFSRRECVTPWDGLLLLLRHNLHVRSLNITLQVISSVFSYFCSKILSKCADSDSYCFSNSSVAEYHYLMPHKKKERIRVRKRRLL